MGQALRMKQASPSATNPPHPPTHITAPNQPRSPAPFKFFTYSKLVGLLH